MAQFHLSVSAALHYTRVTPPWNAVINVVSNTVMIKCHFCWWPCTVRMITFIHTCLSKWTVFSEIVLQAYCTVIVDVILISTEQPWAFFYCDCAFFSPCDWLAHCVCAADWPHLSASCDSSTQYWPACCLSIYLHFHDEVESKILPCLTMPCAHTHTHTVHNIKIKSYQIYAILDAINY